MKTTSRSVKSQPLCGIERHDALAFDMNRCQTQASLLLNLVQRINLGFLRMLIIVFFWNRQHISRQLFQPSNLCGEREWYARAPNDRVIRQRHVQHAISECFVPEFRVMNFRNGSVGVLWLMHRMQDCLYVGCRWTGSHRKCWVDPQTLFAIMTGSSERSTALKYNRTFSLVPFLAIPVGPKRNLSSHVKHATILQLIQENIKFKLFKITLKVVAWSIAVSIIVWCEWN